VPYVIVSDGAAAAIVMDRIFDSARGGKKYLADREGRFFGGKQFRKWSIYLSKSFFQPTYICLPLLKKIRICYNLLLSLNHRFPSEILV
jgi:hypothetical protein